MLRKTLIQRAGGLKSSQYPTASSEQQGLNLSELGADITTPAHAAAGTKKVDRLLSSPKWSKEVMDESLLQQAHQQKLALEAAGEKLIYVWDGSVIENPYSEHVEGMCAVVSSTAKNLRKAKKGAFNQPGGRPSVVLGSELIGGILLGSSALPILTTMRCWTRKGEMASTQREEEKAILAVLAALWGTSVLHVFDRGYAGGPWLKLVLDDGIRFVIRWKKKHLFFNEKGEKMPLSQMGKGKRSWGHKLLWDAQKADLHQNRGGGRSRLACRNDPPVMGGDRATTRRTVGLTHQ